MKALLEAVRTGNTAMVELLRSHKASADIPCIQKYSKVEAGETARSLAERLGNQEIIDLLK